MISRGSLTDVVLSGFIRILEHYKAKVKKEKREYSRPSASSQKPEYIVEIIIYVPGMDF